MFYNKFFSIVFCSVIKIIIEEPSCTGKSKFIQVFKHFNYLSSPSPLYKADEIKVLDSLVVAVVSDFRTHLCCSNALLCIFSILSISCLECGDQNCTACSRCVRARDLYNGRISSLILYVKLQTINHSTLSAVMQLFSVCFCHLRALVTMIHRSRCCLIML